MISRWLTISSLALALVACGGHDSAPIPQCTTNAGCANTAVCLTGQCVDALTQQYALTLKIAVAPAEPDGSQWDTDGSAPDVEATLAPTSGSASPLSWGVQETFSASWPAVVTHFTGDALALTVQDSDPFGADAICTIDLPDTVSLLHQGSLVSNATSCQVTLSLTPVAPVQ
ncbi:MAG: hypothetical protein JST54_14565 [Deltaproteobacteria bacterium]|nr:hypothetical protein [Deltaproteobacteria bacterium]